MSIRTLFTLFVVPCLYILVARDHGDARFDERDAEQTRSYFRGDAEALDAEPRARPGLVAQPAGE